MIVIGDKTYEIYEIFEIFPILWGVVFNRWILILPVFSFVWAVTLMFGLWPLMLALYLLTSSVLVGAVVWGISMHTKAQDSLWKFWRFFTSRGIFLRCVVIVAIVPIVATIAVVVFLSYADWGFILLAWYLCPQLILGVIISLKFRNRRSSASVLKSTSSFAYRYVIVTTVSLLLISVIYSMSFVIGLFFLGGLAALLVGGQADTHQEGVGLAVLAFLIFGAFLSVVLFVLVRILIHVFASLRSRSEV